MVPGSVKRRHGDRWHAAPGQPDRACDEGCLLSIERPLLGAGVPPRRRGRVSGSLVSVCGVRRRRLQMHRPENAAVDCRIAGGRRGRAGLGWLARRGPCRQRLLAARRSACCVFLLGAFFPLLPALLFDDVLVAFFGLPWLLFDDVLVAFFGASSSPPSRFWLARFFSLCDVFLRGASLRFGGLDPQPPIVVVATVGGAGRRGVVWGGVGWGRLPWAAVSLALSRRVMRVKTLEHAAVAAARRAMCAVLRGPAWCVPRGEVHGEAAALLVQETASNVGACVSCVLPNVFSRRISLKGGEAPTTSDSTSHTCRASRTVATTHQWVAPDSCQMEPCGGRVQHFWWLVLVKAGRARQFDPSKKKSLMSWRVQLQLASRLPN